MNELALIRGRTACSRLPEAHRPMRGESHCPFAPRDSHGCSPPFSRVGEGGFGQDDLERRGVGRPTIVYVLSASADAFFPKEYGMLASNLIRSIAELDGETKLARIFEHMKECDGSPILLAHGGQATAGTRGRNGQDNDRGGLHGRMGTAGSPHVPDY